MKRLLLFIFTGLFVFINAKTQNNQLPADAGCSKLISLSEKNISINIDSARYYAYKATQCSNTILQAKAYFILGKLAYTKENYNEALLLYKKAAFIFQDTQNSVELAKIYNNSAIIYEITGKVDSARNYYQKAIEIYSHIKNFDLLAATLINMAVLQKNTGNYNQAIALTDSAEKITNTNRNKLLFTELLIVKASIFQSMGKLTEAMLLLQKALDFATETENYSTLCTIYNNMGFIYKYWGNNQLAMNEFEKSLRISRLYNLDSNRAKALYNIGNIMVETQKTDAALACLLPALQIFDSLGMIIEKANTLNSLGNVYNLLDLTVKAENYYMQAYEIFIECNHLDGMITSLKDLGDLSLEKRNNSAQAIAYYQKSLNYCIQSGNLEMRPYLYYHMGLAYKQNNRIAESEQQFMMAAAQKFKNPFTLLAFKELSDISYQKNDYKKAYDYLQKYNEITDSASFQNQEMIAEKLYASYQLSQLADSISGLHLSAKYAQKKLTRMYLITGTLTFVILIVIMLYFKLLSKQKKIK